jgi:hypothetical protein
MANRISESQKVNLIGVDRDQASQPEEQDSETQRVIEAKSTAAAMH